MIHKNYYTAGKFARRAGVTLKTVHFYDKEDILKPSSHTEAGYRLYNDEDFEKLQRILTLKFLGFSLDEIKDLTKQNGSHNNIAESLTLQESMVDEKINHLKLVKKAITETKQMLQANNLLEWNSFINIINVINKEKILLEQYKNSLNLTTRINLHDRFSLNKQGWHRWLFDQLSIKPGSKILELGCGNASLWSRNLDRIPKDCLFTLTDMSEGMLEDAIEALSGSLTNFSFKNMDAEHITYPENSFDYVIANHMLYHVADRKKSLNEIRRSLKPGGVFYASTIGSNHLKELKELITEFDPSLYITEFDFSEAFGLETGGEQLSQHFSNIKLTRYEDALSVTEAVPIVEYLLSTTGNIRDHLTEEGIENFNIFVDNKIQKYGEIYITKDSGLFECS